MRLETFGKRSSLVMKFLMAVWLLVPSQRASADVSASNAMTTLRHKGASSAGNSGSADQLLFSGSFLYNYPIEVPPGVAGVQPNIALTYNSSGGNSWVGVGWDLSFGSIQRSTKKGAPKYDDETDVFVFSSGGSAQELVSADGGTTNYRSKIEGGFQKFAFNGTSWIVSDKSGTKMYFGETAGARVGPDPNRTFTWGLEKVVDRNGNYVTVSYTKDQDHLYPSTVLYTRHPSTVLVHRRVRFVLENRPDPFSNHRGGFKQVVAKRLQKIETEVSPSGSESGPWDLVRRYSLSYTVRPNGVRSELTAVRLTGIDGSNTITLPSTRFEYKTTSTGWTPTSNFQLPEYMLVDGRDNGVRFTDLNGDGRTDFVIALNLHGGTYHKAWINKTTGWGNPDPMWTPPIATVGVGDHGIWWDTGVRFVDLDGDGKSDVIRAAQYDSANYYETRINNGAGWGSSTDDWRVPDGTWVFTVSNLYNGTRWFRDHGVTLVDINGDGLADLVQSVDVHNGTDYRRIRFNTGTGWEQTDAPSNWNLPADLTLVASDNRSSVSNGVELVDVNGDGLVDVLQRIEHLNFGTVSEGAWLNQGGSWHYAPEWIPPASLMLRDSTVGYDTGMRFADLNGDGLTDIVQSLRWPGQVPEIRKRVWLNTGSGWREESQNWSIPELFSIFWDSASRPQGTALVDVNGDGAADIAKSFYFGADQSQTKKALYTMNASPELMSRATSPLGGTTDLSFTNTVSLNTGSSVNHEVPFPVNVLASVTTNDGRGTSGTVSYEYTGGLYDKVEREFLGFSRVQATDPEGHRSTTYFHQRNGPNGLPAAENALKGRAYKTEVVANSGKVLSRQETTWSFTQPSPGSYFVRPAETRTTSFKMSGTVDRVSSVAYEYDDAGPRLGNVVSTTYRSEAGTSGYDRKELVEYAGVPSDGYLAAFPASTIVLDSLGAEVRKSQFFYDGSTTLGAITKGNVTEVRKWKNIGADQWVKATTGYDSRGRVAWMTDFKQNRSSTVYGAHGLPVSATNALDHAASVSPDIRTGQPLSETDANGVTTRYRYDALGRLVKEIGPLATEAMPDIEHFYNDAFLGSPHQQWIESRVLESTSTGGTIWTKSYFDGLGRTYRADKEEIGGFLIRTETQFNSRGLATRTSVPRKWGGVMALGEPQWIESTYDGLGRVVQVRNPDGTTTATEHDGRLTRVIDALNRVQSSESDAYGRVIKRWEPGIGNPTAYEYDSVGSLTRVTDAKGNQTTFSYDSLGRKTSMVDPNTGTWSYLYDDNGNLAEQTDARGARIAFSYDALNRLTQSKLVGGSPTELGQSIGTVLASYAYDEISDRPYSKGRLTSLTDRSGSTAFYHDALGRVTREVKTVDGTEYAVESQYDALDRMTSLRYPSDQSVTYLYDAAGRLSTATNGSGSLIYAAYGSYNALGAPLSLQVNNGKVRTAYTYDPLKHVLKTLKTDLVDGDSLTAVQDLAYAFSPVGNIMSIADGIDSAKNQTFDYDPLNRLSRAQGSYGLETYTYDSLGNFKVKADEAYSYGHSSHPHAVSKIQPAVAPDIDQDTLVGLGLEPTESLPIGLDGPTFVAGHLGEALSFNSTSHILVVPGTAGLAPDEVTLVAWVRPTAYPSAGFATVIAKMVGSALGNPSDGVRLSIAPNGKAVFEMGRGSSKLTLYSNTAIPLNKWTYLAASANTTKARMFVNGYQQTSRSVTWTPGVNTTLVTIGASLASTGQIASGTQFLGAIDEPRLQGRAWYQSGMTDAYNAYQVNISFLYDDNGNCIEKNSAGLKWNYQFDAEGRLRQVTENDVVKATFVYDHAGNRVKKITPEGTTLYIGKLFEVRPDGSKVDHIFAGEKMVCDVVRSTTGAVNTYYYHTDHLGSVSFVTNSNGLKIQDLVYSPFGEIVSNDGASPLRHKYTGQEQDPEVDLHYYNARYYDPKVGRFISADSIVPSAMDPQSLNRYAYVRNNPMAYSDPTGHSWLDKLQSVVLVVSPSIWLQATPQGQEHLKEYKTSYIAAAIAFVGSGGNPVAAAAAFVAEMGMNTGEGRQITGKVAQEVFQDVLGMRQKAAYIAAGITVRAAIAYGIENGLNAFRNNPLDAKGSSKPDVVDGGSAQDSAMYGPSAKEAASSPKLYSSREARFFELVDKKGVAVGTAYQAPVASFGRVGEALNINHAAVNIVGYTGKSLNALGYGSVGGLCYSAANRAMFSAGYSSTLATLGIGGWSQHFFSAIYGNYGGGVMRNTYWGSELRESYGN